MFHQLERKQRTYQRKNFDNNRCLPMAVHTNTVQMDTGRLWMNSRKLYRSNIARKDKASLKEYQLVYNFLWPYKRRKPHTP